MKTYKEYLNESSDDKEIIAKMFGLDFNPVAIVDLEKFMRIGEVQPFFLDLVDSVKNDNIEVSIERPKLLFLNRKNLTTKRALAYSDIKPSDFIEPTLRNIQKLDRHNQFPSIPQRRK